MLVATVGPRGRCRSLHALFATLGAHDDIKKIRVEVVLGYGDGSRARCVIEHARTRAIVVVDYVNHRSGCVNRELLYVLRVGFIPRHVVNLDGIELVITIFVKRSRPGKLTWLSFNGKQVGYGNRSHNRRGTIEPRRKRIGDHRAVGIKS